MKHSIIIPTAGRPMAIKAAIHSLLQVSPQTCDAEIIIVDNNTSQALSDDLQAYCDTLKNQVRYVREPSPGLSAARHRGVAESNSEWLTFLDDDVEISNSWLSAIQNAFAESEVALIGGPSIPKFTGSIPAWFWDYLAPTPYGGWMCGWLSLLDIGRDVPNINPNFIWGLNFSIRRVVIENCGGFHPDLVPMELQRWQGDGETGLTMKIKEAGYRTDYVNNALVLHLCGPDRLNIDYFKKRAYFQGVCNSFSQIRAGQAPLSGVPKSVSPPFYQKVNRFMRTIWKRPQGQPSSWTIESSEIKKLTDQANQDGWLFHQHEVAADPELLAWVCRKNYLDTNIFEKIDK